MMNLRIKAILSLLVSPIWVPAALLIEHKHDVIDFYSECWNAIKGTHNLQKQKADKNG
jgi:hypothetical protein